MVELTTADYPRRRPSTFRLVSSGVVALAGGLAIASIVLTGFAGGPAAGRAVLPASSATHQGTGSAGEKLRSLPYTTLPTNSPVPSAQPPNAAPAPSAPPTSVVAPAVPASVPAAVPASPQVTSPPVAAGPAASSVADVAALVAQVEATGISPGYTWTWSLGSTSGCGAIPGSNVGTGCTSGAAGSVTTVFAGAPGLLLVAHELANAATENYAVPALVHLVVQSEGRTSWSPIDAVATCLVAHFMHVQDGAAGTWSCPAALADIVAAHIRDAAFTG